MHLRGMEQQIHGMAAPPHLSPCAHLDGQHALKVPAQAVAQLQCDLAGGVQLRAREQRKGVACGQVQSCNKSVAEQSPARSMHLAQAGMTQNPSPAVADKVEPPAPHARTSLRLECIREPISLFWRA